MSLRTRDAVEHRAAQKAPPSRSASPPALRRTTARLRDPKLWLGIVLVLVCMVVGARALASGDETVAVWRVSHDVPSGTSLGAEDVVATSVHFADTAVAATYLSAAQGMPAVLHATRDLHTGELLASSAVTTSAVARIRQLPLAVGPTAEPPDLRPGDHVQVWAVPAPDSTTGGTTDAEPALVLSDVTVLSIGVSVVGVSGERQVVVGLGSDADVGSVLGATNGADVVLIRLAA